MPPELFYLIALVAAAVIGLGISPYAWRAFTRKSHAGRAPVADERRFSVVRDDSDCGESDAAVCDNSCRRLEPCPGGQKPPLSDLWEVRAYYPMSEFPAMDETCHTSAGRMSDWGGGGSSQRDLGWLCKTYDEAKSMKDRLAAAGVSATFREQASHCVVDDEAVCGCDRGAPHKPSDCPLLTVVLEGD